VHSGRSAGTRTGRKIIGRLHLIALLDRHPPLVLALTSCAGRASSEINVVSLIVRLRQIARHHGVSVARH
jgi:hypothetical protein